MFWLDTSPAYFRFYTGTIRLEEKQADEVVGHKLDLTTGMFVTASADEIRTVLAGSDSTDLARLTQNGFVFATEDARRRHLRGEGSVFALYELIDALLSRATQERRRLNDDESAFISVLYRKTYDVWEQELVRRAAGQPPSLACGPKDSPEP